MYVFAKPLICKTFLYNATFTFTLHFFWFNFQSDLVTMLCLYSGHALAWNTCFGRHKQGWRCPNFLAPIHSITLTNVEILCSPVKNIQRFHTLKCWKAPSPLPPAPEKYLPTPFAIPLRLVFQHPLPVSSWGHNSPLFLPIYDHFCAFSPFTYPKLLLALYSVQSAALFRLILLLSEWQMDREMQRRKNITTNFRRLGEKNFSAIAYNFKGQKGLQKRFLSITGVTPCQSSPRGWQTEGSGQTLWGVGAKKKRTCVSSEFQSR